MQFVEESPSVCGCAIFSIYAGFLLIMIFQLAMQCEVTFDIPFHLCLKGITVSKTLLLLGKDLVIKVQEHWSHRLSSRNMLKPVIALLLKHHQNVKTPTGFYTCRIKVEFGHLTESAEINFLSVIASYN